MADIQNIKKTISVKVLIKFSLALVMFFLPFGMWQEAILLGLTVPKLVIPLVFLFILCFYPFLFKIEKTFILLLSFVILISSSLLQGELQFISIFATFLGYCILHMLVFGGLKSHEDILTIIKAFHGGALVVSFCAILSVVTGIDVGSALGKPMVISVFGLPRLLGTEENPNAFAMFYMCAVPISIYLFTLCDSKRHKAFYSISQLMFMICLMLTVSRGAMLGAIIATIFMLGYMQDKFLKRWIIIGILPALALAALNLPSFVVDIANAFFDITDGNPENLVRDKNLSTENKFDVLGPYLKIFSENYLFGIGNGNIIPKSIKLDLHQETTHNIFWAILLDYGLIALLTFLGILAVSFFSMRKISLEQPATQYLNTAPLFLGLILAFSANGLVHELYINFLYWVVIIIGFNYRELSASLKSRVI